MSTIENLGEIPRRPGLWSQVSLNGICHKLNLDNVTALVSGDGSPDDDTIGSDGDFYLDYTGHHLYGPKADGSWYGVPIASLTGPQGDPGADGLSWDLNSSFNPASQSHGTSVTSTVDKDAGVSAFKPGMYVQVFNHSNNWWLTGFITDYTGTTLTWTVLTNNSFNFGGESTDIHFAPGAPAEAVYNVTGDDVSAKSVTVPDGTTRVIFDQTFPATSPDVMTIALPDAGAYLPGEKIEVEVAGSAVLSAGTLLTILPGADGALYVNNGNRANALNGNEGVVVTGPGKKLEFFANGGGGWTTHLDGADFAVTMLASVNGLASVTENTYVISQEIWNGGGGTLPDSTQLVILAADVDTGAGGPEPDSCALFHLPGQSTYGPGGIGIVFVVAAPLASAIKIAPAPYEYLNDSHNGYVLITATDRPAVGYPNMDVFGDHTGWLFNQANFQ